MATTTKSVAKSSKKSNVAVKFAFPKTAPKKQLHTAQPKAGWRKVNLDDGSKITVKIGFNPYKGARAKRFVYRNGMTVAQAVEKGARRPDVKFDLAKGFIEVHRAH